MRLHYFYRDHWRRPKAELYHWPELHPEKRSQNELLNQDQETQSQWRGWEIGEYPSQVLLPSTHPVMPMIRAAATDVCLTTYIYRVQMPCFHHSGQNKLMLKRQMALWKQRSQGFCDIDFLLWSCWRTLLCHLTWRWPLELACIDTCFRLLQKHSHVKAMM